MLLSKGTKCNSKKKKSIIEKKASGLLSSLGIKTPLIKLFCLVIFCFNPTWDGLFWNSNGSGYLAGPRQKEHAVFQ